MLGRGEQGGEGEGGRGTAEEREEAEACVRKCACEDERTKDSTSRASTAAQ